MKEETKTAFNNMVEEMRMKGNKLKKYVFIDRDTKALWSFETMETLHDFMRLYVDESEKSKLKYYNFGRVVSLNE